jgi:hypothetical protein
VSGESIGNIFTHSLISYLSTAVLRPLHDDLLYSRREAAAPLKVIFKLQPGIGHLGKYWLSSAFYP